MSYADDSMEIRTRLEDQIEAVLDDLASGWVERRGVAYLTPKGPKDLGSFTVQLRAGKMPRGSWYRFSQAIGGGSIELVSYQLTGRKDAYKEAFAWAREFLGMDRRNDLTPEQKAEFAEKKRREEAERAERAAAAQAEQAERREERIQTAAGVWKETKPIAGTLADTYLQSRGFPPVATWPWSPDTVMRFHPNLPYELDRKAGSFPALICRVADAYGSGAAIWRIYLARDGKGKAPVDVAKVGLGPAGGGAVRIGGDGPSVGATEGVETALGAWFLNGCSKPVWATLSTSGMTGLELPAFVEKLEIFPDGDKAKLQLRPNGDEVLSHRPGMAAARTLEAEALAILGEGNVSIAQEPIPGRDYADIYNEMKKKGLI